MNRESVNMFEEMQTKMKPARANVLLTELFRMQGAVMHWRSKYPQLD